MTEKVTLKIQGMECASCSMNLERIEEKLAGVIFAEASYRREQLVVEYDETQVDLAQIEAAVNRLGYGVVDIR